MISQAESGLTAAQYTALLAAVDDAHAAPSLKVTLKPYAPNWSNRPHFYTTSLSDFDAAIGLYSGVSNIVAAFADPTDNTILRLRRLSLEDSGDQTWQNAGSYTESFGVFGVSAAQSLASPAITDIVHTEVAGAFLYVKRFQNGSLISSTTDIVQGMTPYTGMLKKTAVVDDHQMHVIAVTNNGNWRLGYVDSTSGTNEYIWSWSEILWPYQVRSFDAVRLPSKGYDIIAMVTDLPPITDYTVSGTKMVAVEQRVQGIVLFKFDYVNKTWSDHRLFDVADNKKAIVRENVKLSRYVDGDEVFMTYAKEYGGVVGQAITKSLDGVNWENPIFYMDIGTKANVDACFPMPIVRNGRFMYLVGGEYQADSSGMGVKRANATSFIPDPDDQLVEDVTPYVLSLGGQITASRQISLVLSNPEEVLTQPSRLLGSSPLRALRAEIKAGFWTSVGECLVSVLEGDVISVDEDHSLPVIRLPIAVRDSSNLPGLVGTSDATEWPGLAFGGDNYAPRTTDDTLGASGLGHTALHGGSWTGSTGGLSMEANGKEGAAYTTFISRAFLGTLTAEISFYKSINQVNMSVLGIQPTQVASGTEYAGLGFRIQDNDNLWFVRYKPGKETAAPPNNIFTFELVKRTKGVTTNIETVVATTTRNVNNSYPKYYSSRLIIVWKYSLIKVFWMTDPTQAGAPEQLFEAEAYGMGDNDFMDGDNPRSVTMEGGTMGRPFTIGAAGFLAYSALSDRLDIAVNGDAEDGTTTNWLSDNNATVINTAAVPEGRSPRCIKVTTDPDSNNSGVHYLMTGLTGQGLKLQIKAYVWIESGDEDTSDDAQVEVRVRLFYTDGSKVKSSTTTFKSRAQWEEWVWNVETDQAKNISYCEVWFMDKRGFWLTDLPTVYYVDDVSISKEVTPPRIYFGNADFSDGQPVYSAQDAIHALYAFSGQHLVDRRAALEDRCTADVDTTKWTVINPMTEVLGQYTGTGTIASILTFPLPIIFQAEIFSDFGRVGLTAGDPASAWPIEVKWTDTETHLAVNTGAGTFVREVPHGLGRGLLKVAVTTRRYEGLSFAKDKDAANVLDWLTVAVYMNDTLVLCGSAPLFNAASSAYKVCFAGNGANAITLDNIWVDELHRLVPYFSVDPGERVGAGLGRIVGASRSVPLARFNDHVLIGRIPIEDPSGGGWTPDWAIPLGRGRKSNIKNDMLVPSHYRLVGAWTERDVFDSVGLHRTWRHFFVKKDDPNLMTDPEIAAEEAYVLRDLIAARSRMGISTQFHPLLEMGDSISYDGRNWQVEAVEWTINKAANDSVVSGSTITVHEI